MSLCLVFLAGCSFDSTRPPLTIKINGAALKEQLLRNGRSSYNCYFVSVSGSGIAPNFGPLNLGARSPQCLGLGVTSDLLSLSDLEAVGTKLQVASGPKREMRILGVETNLPNCSGQPLGNIFGSRRPKIYILASAVADTFNDTKITVHPLKGAGEPTDIVEPCDSANSNDLLNPTGGTLAVASSVTGSSFIKSYAIDGNLGLTSLNDQYSITPYLYITGLPLAPDAHKIFAFAPETSGGTAYVRRFNPGIRGELNTEALDLGEQFLTHLAQKVAFSSDSKFAYFENGTALHQYSIGSRSLTPLEMPTCTMAPSSTFRLSKGFVHVISNNNVLSGKISDDGDICKYAAGGVETAVSSTIFANPVITQIGPNNVFYEVFFLAASGRPVPGYYLAAFKIDPNNGRLSQMGSSHILHIASPDEMDFDPLSRFAYFILNSRTSLNVVTLKSDGSPLANAGIKSLASGRSLTVDPLGRSVFLIESSLVVNQFSVSTVGALTQVANSLSPAPGSSFDKLKTIPLY